MACELPKIVELDDVELDLVAGGALVKVEVEVEKSFNNNDVAVALQALTANSNQQIFQ